MARPRARELRRSAELLESRRVDDPRPLLEHLDATAAGDGLLGGLAYLAASDVRFAEHELNAALRRALLVVAAGGDPHRALGPDDRAVAGLAADLDSPGGRTDLASALDGLRGAAGGLRDATAALDLLRSDADLAWRWLACALLAAEVAGEEDDESGDDPSTG